MSITHEERRQRREQIAIEARSMFETNRSRTAVVADLAAKYRVGLSTVNMALREHKITVPELPKNLPQQPEFCDNVKKIFEALKSSNKTYREIAEELRVTKQYVSFVHKRLLSEGYDVPLRSEVRDRLRFAKDEAMRRKDEEFARLLVESNNFEESARIAGISLVRANKVRRQLRLNGTGLIIDKNICDEHPSLRITRRWLYLVADLINTDMPLTEIAEKWKKPKPFVFNLADECRQAGIVIAEHRDGRHAPRNRPPAKLRVCKTCGCNFKSWRRLPDGTIQRAWASRTHCLDCKPFEGKKGLEESQNSKSSTDNNLQESAAN
jgi:hypothetical protein